MLPPFPVLCPRCGVSVSFFRKDGFSPYCAECGWNLDFVSKVTRDRRRLVPIFFGLPFLIALAARVYGASLRGTLITFMVVIVLAAFAYARARKLSQRACGLVDLIARKPGADISSNAPDESPAKVLACEAALRASPPKVGFGRFSPMFILFIWILRIFPAALVFLTLRSLFDVGYRLPSSPGPGLYVAQTLLALGLWLFFLWIARPRPPLPTQALQGAISMARVCWTKPPELGTVAYEFRDLDGRLLRTARPSNLGSIYSGTYVPVFYDPADSSNCFAAFDVVYEPTGAAAKASLRGRVSVSRQELQTSMRCASTRIPPPLHPSIRPCARSQSRRSP
jgi:hypothetical protein